MEVGSFDGFWFFRWHRLVVCFFIYLIFWLLLQLKQQSFPYDGVLSYEFLVVLLPVFSCWYLFCLGFFLRRGRFYVIVGVLLFDSCFWLPTTCVLNPCGGYFGSREFFGFCRFPMDRRRVHKCYPTFLHIGGCGSGRVRLRYSIKWISNCDWIFFLFSKLVEHGSDLCLTFGRLPQ